MPGKINLLGNTESKIPESKIPNNENVENVTHVKIIEIILVHCIFVKNAYQHDSRALYVFIHTKSFGRLLDISPKNAVFLKTLTQRFHILNYGLLIKVLNRLSWR